jgi:hypothetical protein
LINKGTFKELKNEIVCLPDSQTKRKLKTLSTDRQAKSEIKGKVSEA